MKRSFLNIAAMFGVVAMASSSLKQGTETPTYSKKPFSGNPVFIPKKHNISSYRGQQRAAIKRKNKKKFNNK